MRRLPTVLLCLLLPGGGPVAGEESTAAFLDVVNLVCLDQPTRISLGEFAFNQGEPVAAGESSGLLAIVPGRHLLRLVNPGAIPPELSVTVELEAGKTVVVVCFDESREFADGSRQVRLRTSVLGEGGKAGPRLSLVSLLREPFSGVEVSGAALTLTPRQAVPLDLALGDAVDIRMGRRVLIQFEVTKPIHYLGFLFEDPRTGEPGLSLVQHGKLEYQPPLEGEP